VPEEKFPLPELLETSAIIVLLISFLFYGRLLLSRSLAATATLSCLLIAARIAMVVFRFPEALYQTALFSPAYYASSFLFNFTRRFAAQCSDHVGGRVGFLSSCRGFKTICCPEIFRSCH
jgi:hypothetical protein